MVSVLEKCSPCYLCSPYFREHKIVLKNIYQTTLKNINQIVLGFLKNCSQEQFFNTRSVRPRLVHENFQFYPKFRI